MNETPEFIPTRQTLLSRLGDLDNQTSWKEFFDTYWKLIYSTAIKSGLSDAEAQDVVQETVLSVVKNIGQFHYDPATGSFKGWLLKLTRWRIVDQVRKRQPGGANRPNDRPDPESRTSTVERIPDPAGNWLDNVWDEEWEKNVGEVAVERVKQQVDPRHFQAFDLYVLKNWPARKVAETLKMNIAQVYLNKHRVASLIKKEIKALEKKYSA